MKFISFSGISWVFFMNYIVLSPFLLLRLCQEKTKTRGEKLTSKVTDAIANRQMNLKRSDLFVKPDVSTLSTVASQKYMSFNNIQIPDFDNDDS